MSSCIKQRFVLLFHRLKLTLE